MPRVPRFPAYPSKKHPTGQARIRLNGKQVYLGVFGSPESWRKYHQLQSEWAAGLAGCETQPKPNRNPTENPGTITVAEAVARWTRHAGEHYDPAGREGGQFRYALQVVVRLFGSRPVSEFDSLSLETVQKAMATGSWMSLEEKEAARKRGLEIGWCRNVVNRRTVRVQTAWRWLERQRLVPEGRHANLCTVGGLRLNDRSVRHTKRREPATWEQVQKVLPHIQAKRRHRPVAAMLEVQWFSGARSGEVRQMRPCDIDRTGEVWLYRPQSHKTAHLGQDRIIALGPECQRVLAPWLLRAKRKDHPLFTTTKKGKKPYTAFAYCQAVRRAVAKAGLPKGWSPYQCRHAAKLRITRAMGLDAARAQLGQKSLSSTNGYAAQQDLETAAEVAKKLG